jgi:hypothetical protein
MNIYTEKIDSVVICNIVHTRQHEVQAEISLQAEPELLWQFG